MRRYAVIFLIAIAALCGARLYAQEDGGVSYFRVDSGAPSPAAPFALPQDKAVDDDVLLSRKPKTTYRFNICAEGLSEAAYRRNESTNDVNRFINLLSGCKIYSAAADTPQIRRRLLDTSAQDFNYPVLNRIYVKEVFSSQEKLAEINIRNSKPSAAPAKIIPQDGTVYKFILMDKKKIKRLSNYTDDEIAVKLDRLMQDNKLQAQPVRISVYEDYTPDANSAAAVYTFSGGKRFVEDIADMNQSGMIYDIKPDYAVKYTPTDK